MGVATVISAVRDRAVYAGLRTAICIGTVAEPDATLAGMARLGRLYGAAPFNRKRLERAVSHLGEAFPHWSDERKREYALRGYEHLAMLGGEMALMPRLMSKEGWAERARLVGIRPALDQLLRGRPCMLVTGHVGNWELGGTLMAMLGFKIHAIYRPLDMAPLDAWVQDSRSRKGLMLLDKHSTAKGLPEVFGRGECAAFVADQNAGVRGMFVPFFGRLASSYKAIGLMAQRFQTPVVVAWAKRVGGAEIGGEGSDGRRLVQHARALRFDMHIQDAFGPEAWEGQPDPVFYITARYRRALEAAFAEAPDQVLWMHRFWKSRPPHERKRRPFPEALARKLRELPWMTEGELQRIIARSERDTAEYAADPKNAAESDGPGSAEEPAGV
ncbi:MAG TPA: lysophospholipid acyltransferase family protein [Phycisphaerales bacterium]|nr:lysophospholipid acyltransferase family protein [Phycisphaerales bacterium]